MSKLLSLFVIAVVGIGISFTDVRAARAAAVAPLATPQFVFAVPVGGGCGLGVRRGPYNDCAPVSVYGGYYRAYVHGYYRGYRRGYYRGYHDAYYPYVRYYSDGGIAVDQGGCAFGSYPVCNGVACWRVCY